MNRCEVQEAGIRANPADDLRRMVYADWLDENGEAERAEFIRVQIELAKLRQCCGYGGVPWSHPGGRCGLSGCEFCELKRRERGLWERHAGEWFGLHATITPPDTGGRPDIQLHVVRRGFVAEIRLPRLADWLGVTCRRCSGEGCSVYSVASLGPCQNADGVGRRIVAEHPVERVTIPGLIHPREYGGGDDRWAVYRDQLGPVWDVMCPGCSPDDVFAERSDRREVEDALSAALILNASSNLTQQPV